MATNKIKTAHCDECKHFNVESIFKVMVCKKNYKPRWFSSIGNGDIGAAVEAAMRDANISHHAEMAANAVICAASEYKRPSVLFRPKLSIDGNQWCVLYGDNLQDGVAGFGDSITKAMWDFDLAWHKDLPSNAALTGKPRGEL